ncbi:accessory Sec system glycosyltransferase GtfA [Staphylococcus intermedius]|uniref:accessory Sec system glycosyltransferase GtfA n=1 Tax=Staphylococcus intermedius TaxID=1285 RepID=UPI000BBC1824|nr:accessory Sec system glycosyltransferase GtfA [Staphylococcus intermedius]PCF86167.1 accessory Sec system glycosyltransferase GtfA [Staphylococcus intermedius]
MTIYSINFGIGWASSGVEYAQAYRAKLLRHTNETARFIFLDFIQHENIQALTHNIGFRNDEVIWLYQYFTDIPIAPTTYRVDDLINDLSNPVQRVEHVGKIKRLILDNNATFVTCYLTNEDTDIVHRAEFVINGMLVRKDFYSYVRVFSEYYAPKDNQATLYMRQFYNEDGSIAYQEYMAKDAKQSIYRFDDMICYGKLELIAYFIKKLQLSSEDIVILDRASEIGQAVLQNKGESRIGVVVHAEHFSENLSDDDNILWNNYYEYQFSRANDFDFFITATEVQKRILSEQLLKYKGLKPRIFTIPVGSLEKLKEPEPHGRQPYAIMTASRLASEKHLDWLIKAVMKAKVEVPQLTFDIYGEGGEKEQLTTLVHTNEAQDYIKLRGHVNLSEVYAQYELFLSGSTSEGFGLTLMEAVGSGLGMIGLDVNYGNPTFISDQKNGYLIPYNTVEQTIEDIARAIVQYFNHGPTHPHETSYAIAEPFLTTHIIDKWKNLISEVLYD